MVIGFVEAEYMKNTLFWSILVVLALGIICLHFSYTRGGVKNWELANLPFPGAGLVVASTFHIENGGKFDLELNVPMSSQISGRMPPRPPIKTKLKVTIAGGNNFRNTQYIEEFKSFGLVGFERIILYSSGSTIKLPRKGDYSIEIVNEDHNSVFENCSKTGGMIRLVRDNGQITETYLRYLLLHVLSYALTIVSIVGLVIFGISMHFKKRLIAPDGTTHRPEDS